MNLHFGVLGGDSRGANLVALAAHNTHTLLRTRNAVTEMDINTNKEMPDEKTQSRNRHIGLEQGKGNLFDVSSREMVRVPKSVKTVPAVMMTEQNGLQMPITTDDSRVVQEGGYAKSIFYGLLQTGFRDESEPG